MALNYKHLPYIDEETLEQHLDDMEYYMLQIKQVVQLGWPVYETAQSINQVIGYMEGTLEKARTKIKK
ncbi:hypothetical protein [Risungbinella massiliensis]|uniref:hypothetical protein n=1 Tax=Risungbinella massiliensis TaxID=1329796 RepID=UPI0005CBFE89|nr:hypothetical protein [Risungbinella massiliensis]